MNTGKFIQQSRESNEVAAATTTNAIIHHRDLVNSNIEFHFWYPNIELKYSEQ